MPWEKNERKMKKLWEDYEKYENDNHSQKAIRENMKKLWEKYDNENHSQKDSLEITRRREGHTHKAQKPVIQITIRCDTNHNYHEIQSTHKDQKPVNTIVFKVRAGQGSHEYKYLDHTKTKNQMWTKTQPKATKRNAGTKIEFAPCVGKAKS